MFEHRSKGGTRTYCYTIGEKTELSQSEVYKQSCRSEKDLIIKKKLHKIIPFNHDIGKCHRTAFIIDSTSSVQSYKASPITIQINNKHTTRSSNYHSLLNHKAGIDIV